VNTTLTQAIDRKAQARRHWQGASFNDKIAALIRMQAMAREMARASGRRFAGVVWRTSDFLAAPRK
jgi:hypothetical protein